MRVALIVYHKNVNEIYKKEWIDCFRNSILGQTFKDFFIYELNYGSGQERIFDNSIYESKELPTFIHAMNYLIKKCLDDGADVLANTNCDDVYVADWLKIQLPFIEQNYDVVSCNFSLFKDDNIYHEHHFENVNIKHELNKNHNPLCHPAICYSKNYLENNRYDPSHFPVEDMLLWKRTIDAYRFKIVKENLLYHRIHSNSVCQSLNR